MKMKGILVVLIMLISSSVYAEKCTLTVMAKSGLNLRSEPSIDSRKIVTVSFGETVLTDGICEFDYARKETIQIDGVFGFWLPIEYKNYNGYMFSAYLAEGELFPYVDKDIDFVLIDQFFDPEDYVNEKPFDGFDFRHYNPELNWYGVKLRENKLLITEIEIELKFDNSNAPNCPGIYSDTKPCVYLDFPNKKDYLFLIGRKERFDFDLTRDVAIIENHGNYDNSDSLYQYRVRTDNKLIMWKGVDSESISKQGFETIYSRIELENGSGYEKLDNKIPVRGALGKEICVIVDLNNDSIDDYFIWIATWEGKCGVVPFVRVLLSDQVQDNVNYHFSEYWLNSDNFYLNNN